MKRMSKRAWVLVGIIAVVAAVTAVGGYAYWTSSGEGTGTADTGTNVAFVVTQLAPHRSTWYRAALLRTSRSTSRTRRASTST